MSAATLDSRSFEAQSTPKRVASGRQGVVSPAKPQPRKLDEAYWKARAVQLMSVPMGDDRPTTSGKFGTFLF